MSASSQSYLDSALPAPTLTITEVEVEPSTTLGKSNIYLCAAAGAALGILLGVGVAASLSLPERLPRMLGAAGSSAPAQDRGPQRQLADRDAHAAITPPGPKDFGSASFDAAGLTGHLTADWNNNATYRLVIEPASPTQQAGFSMAVAGSERPLSVNFRLIDAKGAVLCGQDALVRFNPSRAGSANTGAAELGRLEAQESVRERGHDIFENEIGDEGEIAAINARGAMPCSVQAYASAASWTFSAEFPSLADQAELLKQAQPAASQKAAHSAKPGAVKKPIPHNLTAALESFVVPKPAQ